jgi:hypothetical protein
VNGETYNEPRYAKEILGAGLVTGLVGGVLLAAAAAMVALAVGIAPGDLARGISAVFRGDAAMAGGAGDVLLGILVHLVVAVAAAIVFAWLIGRDTSRANATLGAVAFAVVMWAIMLHTAVPAAAPAFEARAEAAPAWLWLVIHLFYGLPLAPSPALQRRIGRVPGPRAEEPHEYVGRSSQIPAEF